MQKFCKNIVKNIKCWICDSPLDKIKGKFYWIIKCSNKNCQAHAILITEDELSKLEEE